MNYQNDQIYESFRMIDNSKYNNTQKLKEF